MGFFILFYRWSLDQELILVFLLIFSVLGRIIHMFLRWACGLEQEGSDLFGLQEEWKLPGSFAGALRGRPLQDKTLITTSASAPSSSSKVLGM